MSIRSVAILGGGIMGCSLALEFARHGIKTVIFDENDTLFAGASRWNEGKIHLGYMYSAERTLDTTKKILPGGLAFKPLVESLIGTGIDHLVTQTDDHYLCHRDSVVSPADMAAHFRKVDQLVAEHPDAGAYLVDARRARAVQLDDGELEEITGSNRIVAGFRVPERSVQTNPMADLFIGALQQESRIEARTSVRVLGVNSHSGINTDDRWRIVTAKGIEGPFDCVVNALWQGRLAVDVAAGLALPSDWSHRYRLALFLRSAQELLLPSAVIAAGPFGDIKNYNGRDIYLSWYPLGLQIENRAIDPPPFSDLSAAIRDQLDVKILSALAEYFPAVKSLHNPVWQTLAGGWVYAAASGSLADPQAAIHGRANFGVQRKGTYLSVDTGKFSTAPWLAQLVVNAVSGK